MRAAGIASLLAAASVLVPAASAAGRGHGGVLFTAAMRSAAGGRVVTITNTGTNALVAVDVRLTSGAITAARGASGLRCAIRRATATHVGYAACTTRLAPGRAAAIRLTTTGRNGGARVTARDTTGAAYTAEINES